MPEPKTIFQGVPAPFNQTKFLTLGTFMSKNVIKNIYMSTRANLSDDLNSFQDLLLEIFHARITFFLRVQ